MKTSSLFSKAAVLMICTAGSMVSLPNLAIAGRFDEAALAAAGVISKSQAIAVAKNAVGGGTVISAVFEKQDGVPHWSVDIVGSRFEYEVWVSVSGAVLRIITQPK